MKSSTSIAITPARRTSSSILEPSTTDRCSDNAYVTLSATVVALGNRRTTASLSLDNRIHRCARRAPVWLRLGCDRRCQALLRGVFSSHVPSVDRVGKQLRSACLLRWIAPCRTLFRSVWQAETTCIVRASLCPVFHSHRVGAQLRCFHHVAHHRRSRNRTGIKRLANVHRRNQPCAMARTAGLFFFVCVCFRFFCCFVFFLVFRCCV